MSAPVMKPVSELASSPRRGARRNQFRRNGTMYALLALPLVLYAVLGYLPMFWGVVAFQNYSVWLGVSGSPWVGWQNFQSVFGDPYFWQVFRNTLELGLLVFAFGFPAPILMALFINELKDGPFKRVTQSVATLPYFVSLVALVNIAVIMLTPSGLVDGAIQAVGGQPINFIIQSVWFRPIYIVLNLWAGTGWGAIIYLAAITGIDPQLYEAAYVDGAGRLGRAFHVTLPGILPTMATIFLLSLPAIIFFPVAQGAGFEMALLLQNPLIMDVADIIGTFVYRRGILLNDYGYATAVSLIWSVGSLAIIFTANRIVRRLTEAGLW